MAEWLGSGLQHHLQRFESARHLKKAVSYIEAAFVLLTPFCFYLTVFWHFFMIFARQIKKYENLPNRNGQF